MREYPTNVAIYWDFENIQASLVEKKGGFGAYGRTKYQNQEPLIDVDSVMEFAATFGVVSINRAYCNWQWYGKYREALLQNGLELIQLFHPGASGKNGGDIKLCLDCTEDLLRFPHIDVVVIVGGDSDYLPLAQKIKALGKMLVGIGTQANTNRHWARGCHEFKFYESIILDDEPVHNEPPAPSQPTPQVGSPSNGQIVSAPDQVVKAHPEELLRRAIRRLSGKSGDPWVLKGSIRPMLKRLDPTFEEGQHGAKNFSAFMKKFEQILEVRPGKNDQEIRLKGGPDRVLDPVAEKVANDKSHGRHPVRQSGPETPVDQVREKEPIDQPTGALPMDPETVISQGAIIEMEAAPAVTPIAQGAGRNRQPRRRGSREAQPKDAAAEKPALKPAAAPSPEPATVPKKPRAKGSPRKS